MAVAARTRINNNKNARDSSHRGASVIFFCHYSNPKAVRLSHTSYFLIPYSFLDFYTILC